MCTAVTFTDKKSHHYLARTMDFSFELDTRVVSIPKNHVFDSLVSDVSFKTEHAFLAAGQEIEGYGYSFGDGFNEKGFAIASLYFEKYAKYSAAPVFRKRKRLGVSFSHFKCSGYSERRQEKVGRTFRLYAV